MTPYSFIGNYMENEYQQIGYEEKRKENIFRKGVKKVLVSIGGILIRVGGGKEQPDIRRPAY